MSNIAISKNSKNSKNSKDNSKSFIDSILEYESVVVFGGLGIVVLGTIILTGMFQAGPSQRSTVFFNAAGAIFMGAGFIYIIFTFMGRQVIFLDNKIDVGMLMYVAIVLFVMFVLGN